MNAAELTRGARFKGNRKFRLPRSVLRWVTFSCRWARKRSGRRSTRPWCWRKSFL